MELDLSKILVSRVKDCDDTDHAWKIWIWKLTPVCFFLVRFTRKLILWCYNIDLILLTVNSMK